MRKRKSGKACKAEAVQLVFAERSAEFKPASDIFVVTGTFGSDCGISQLADLMRSYGILFYKSPTRADNRGPSGLIARDDTIILKVNSQWDERGGTNTDLLKALIRAITLHPDGFAGEVIVADNGQGLRLSMEEIAHAGYRTTVDEAHMNVYVAHVAPSY